MHTKYVFFTYLAFVCLCLRIHQHVYCEIHVVSFMYVGDSWAVLFIIAGIILRDVGREMVWYTLRDHCMRYFKYNASTHIL